MNALFLKLARQRVTAVGWTILIIVLMCLPGEALPGEGLFSIPHLDKAVHLILFAGLFLFWSLSSWYAVSNPEKKGKIFPSVLGWTIFFGIAMEFVQLFFIPNRSFDIWDILFDSLGAGSGFWLLRAKGHSWKWLKDR